MFMIVFVSQFPDWASGAACKTDSEQQGQECACLLGPRSNERLVRSVRFQVSEFCKGWVPSLKIDWGIIIRYYFG